MKPVSTISTGLLLILVALAIVVVLTTCAGCTKVVPYNQHPEYTSTKDEGFQPIHYASYPEGNNIDAQEKHRMDSGCGDDTVQRMKNMSGLFGPQKETKLDTYSEAKGGLTEDCMLKSSGMSNSQGYLCLNKKQIKLLKTRGGNLTSE